MQKPTKKLLAFAVVLCVSWMLIGCSSMASAPRMARICIKGPANHTNEFIISLDDPTRENTDIHLSDRYAIKLDLQWLWYEKEDIKREENISDVSNSPLAPWFICKYRF